MAWPIVFHPEVEQWLADTDTDVPDRVAAAVDVLSVEGPQLGRPYVDQIKTSKHKNMKELRAGSIRILFAFDPARQAICLVAGDKAGDWNKWYRRNVPIADARFDEHLKGR